MQSEHISSFSLPGYSPKDPYPGFYILHGIGGAETEWQQPGSPEAILDNLYTDEVG